jgi:hypothetical protein
MLKIVLKGVNEMSHLSSILVPAMYFFLFELTRKYSILLLYRLFLARLFIIINIITAIKAIDTIGTITMITIWEASHTSVKENLCV